MVCPFIFRSYSRKPQIIQGAYGIKPGSTCKPKEQVQGFPFLLHHGYQAQRRPFYSVEIA